MPVPTLTSLLTELNRLQQRRTPQTTTLHDKLYEAYRTETLDKLDTLLNTGNPKLQKTGEFLAKNWTLINGTLLSYTALPNDDLTKLLIEVAKYVKQHSKEYRDTPLLKLLMPTVATETCSNHYPSLDDPNLDIQHILRTHILGRGGQYLIPVQQLIDFQQIDSRQWFNAYFDYKLHPIEFAIITEEEYQQLVQHSQATQTLDDAQKQYESHTQEQGSLLAQLKKLIQHLYFNSKKGIGAETNAGNEVYGAIIVFHKYYDTLDNKDKKAIPHSLRTKIEFLLRLSKDPLLNDNATEHTETCIDSHRQLLESRIEPCEEILSKIGINDITRARVVKEKKDHWINSRNALKTELSKKSYIGFDKAGFNLHLLKHLQVTCEITSFSNLKIMMRSNSLDITQICPPLSNTQISHLFPNIETFVQFAKDTSPEKLKAFLSIIETKLTLTVLNSTTDMFSVLMRMDPSRAEIICHTLKPRFCHYPIFFSNLMKRLTPEICSILIKALAEDLPAIITDASKLIKLMKRQTPDNKAAIFTNMQNKMSSLVMSSLEFNQIMGLLSDEHRILMTNLQLKIQIHNCYDIRAVMQFLPDSKRSNLYNKLKNNKQIIFTQARELEALLEFLPPEERADVFLQNRDLIFSLVKNVGDFNKILKYLSSEHRTEVYNNTQIDNFLYPRSNTISSIFSLFIEYLTTEQKIEVYETYKNMLLLSILDKSSTGVFNIVHYLPSEHYETVFHDLENGTDEYLFNFMSALTQLQSDQVTTLCRLMKDRVPTRINGQLNPLFFSLRFSRVRSEAESENIKCLFATWPDLITNFNQLIEIMNFMPDFHWPLIFNQFKQSLPEIIQTPKQFKRLVELTSSNKNVIGSLCQTIPEHLTKFIPISEFKSTLTDFLGAQGLPEKTIQRWIFDGLLQEMSEIKTKLGSDNTCSQKHEIADAFRKNLKDAVDAYFDLDAPSPEALTVFQTQCRTFITEAKPVLKEHRDWYDFFAKLTLALATAFIIPAVIIVANGITTGQWEYRLFKTNSEKKLDKVTEAVKQMSIQL